jgi:hypothetical protein
MDFTKNDTAFRTREVEKIEVPEKPAEVTGIVEKKEEVFDNNSDNLESWEITNGKYGLDYFGIKEIGKTFPLNAQFGLIDKYIKDELSLKGYDKTTKGYQEILDSIEKEIGSSKLSAYERLKKLSGYVRAIKRFEDAKKKKELYTSFKS